MSDSSIDIKISGRNVAITPRGKLSINNGFDETRPVLNQFRDEKAESIEVDLTHCTHIDSSGLGLLLMLQEACANKVRLLHPQPGVASVLKTALMERIMEVVA
ncbi:STAS domain-containing protein [Magnetofaba australis]|nr:STAS domain-containing protein [Magnetofaba australis]